MIGLKKVKKLILLSEEYLKRIKNCNIPNICIRFNLIYHKTLFKKIENEPFSEIYVTLATFQDF